MIIILPRRAAERVPVESETKELHWVIEGMTLDFPKMRGKNDPIFWEYETYSTC